MDFRLASFFLFYIVIPFVLILSFFNNFLESDHQMLQLKRLKKIEEKNKKNTLLAKYFSIFCNVIVIIIKG
jgi:uncharacterized sodium:solute symporter family permease YidK